MSVTNQASHRAKQESTDQKGPNDKIKTPTKLKENLDMKGDPANQGSG